MPKLLRKDFVLLADQRMADARVLAAAGRHPGAYHSGGVALECMLKARIAKLTQAEEFPDKEFARNVWNHDPAALLGWGELRTFLDNADQAVQTNWATVKDWKVDSRYTQTVNPATVTAFLDALDNPKDGVLQWLRTYC